MFSSSTYAAFGVSITMMYGAGSQQQQGSVTVNCLPSWSVLGDFEFKMTRRVNLEQTPLPDEYRSEAPQLRVGDLTSMSPQESNVRLGLRLSSVPAGKRATVHPSYFNAVVLSPASIMAATAAQVLKGEDASPGGLDEFVVFQNKTHGLYTAIALDQANHVVGFRLIVPNDDGAFRELEKKLRGLFGQPTQAWKRDSNGGQTPWQEAVGTGVLLYSWGWSKAAADDLPVAGTTVVTLTYHSGLSVRANPRVITVPSATVLDIVSSQVQHWGGFDSLVSWSSPYHTDLTPKKTWKVRVHRRHTSSFSDILIWTISVKLGLSA